MHAILATRMYLENFIQNKKLFFIRNDKTSNKTKLPVVITLDDNEDDRTTIVRSMVKVERA